MKNSIVIGAGSGLGRRITEQLAVKGDNLTICGRNRRDIDSVASNIGIKYNVKVSIIIIDINNKNDRDNLIAYAKENCNYNNVFITTGLVNKNDNVTLNENERELIVKTNFLSVIHLVAEFVEIFKNKNSGNIIVCSSIATARPRRNNIAYSSAKIALEFYCKGLQHSLVKTNVKIQIYKLGYIDTAMSYGMNLLFPIAKAEKIAILIIKNLDKNKRVIYLPKFWAVIAFIIKLVPWNIYKRVSF